MSIFLRILKYIWRAWPAILILLLLVIHVFLIQYLGLPYSVTHKTISLFSQLLGGLLVLYSIDSNIGIFKDKNLFDLFKSYLKEFPLIKRNYVIHANTGRITIGTGEVKARVIRHPKTVDEKLEYLQEQVDGLRKELDARSAKIYKSIEKSTKTLNERTDKAQSAIDSMGTKIEEVSIGGLKIQLFGILLLIYGSITGYIA